MDENQSPDQRKLQLYDMILRTWSAQVDSDWQRNSYFAAFEIAAPGGTWVVFHQGDWRAGCLFFWLGIVLTLFWIYNNLKTYAYHMYWWKSLEEIENTAVGPLPRYASDYDNRRTGFGLDLKWKWPWSWRWKWRYSKVTTWGMPVLFLAGWIGLLIIELCEIAVRCL
jgi:hypothetical protein